MNLLRTSVLGLALITLFISCSSSKKTTTEPATREPAPEPVSIYPSWYNQSGFEADSVSYSAFYTAISADSLRALEAASTFARNKLESELANKLESVRTELASSGNNTVQQRDFIIILRNAHQQITEAAVVSESVSNYIEEEGHYRGFSKVTITHPDLISTLEEGFSGYDSYWSQFSSSSAFSSEFQ